MKEEILRILKMVEEGKVSAEEGANLIEAMGVEEKRGAERPFPHLLTIKVEEAGGTRVNVNVPIKLAKFFLKLIPKSVLGKLRIGKVEVPVGELGEIDVDELISALSEVPDGKIVEVREPEGTVVEITVV
jgi:hypothetical protein